MRRRCTWETRAALRRLNGGAPPLELPSAHAFVLLSLSLSLIFLGSADTIQVLLPVATASTQCRRRQPGLQQDDRRGETPLVGEVCWGSGRRRLQGCFLSETPRVEVLHAALVFNVPWLTREGQSAFVSPAFPEAHLSVEQLNDCSS